MCWHSSQKQVHDNHNNNLTDNNDYCRFILTAGHCVRYCLTPNYPNCSNPIPFSDLTIKVVLGEYNYKDRDNEESVQRFHAANIYLHPKYANKFKIRKSGYMESEPHHDIAILKLDRDVSVSSLP